MILLGIAKARGLSLVEMVGTASRMPSHLIQAPALASLCVGFALLADKIADTCTTSVWPLESHQRSSTASK